MIWQWIVIGIAVIYAVVRLVAGIRRSIRKGNVGGCAGCALAEQCAKRKDDQSGCGDGDTR